MARYSDKKIYYRTRTSIINKQNNRKSKKYDYCILITFLFLLGCYIKFRNDVKNEFINNYKNVTHNGHKLKSVFPEIEYIKCELSYCEKGKCIYKHQLNTKTMRGKDRDDNWYYKHITYANNKLHFLMHDPCLWNYVVFSGKFWKIDDKYMFEGEYKPLLRKSDTIIGYCYKIE